jgi:Arc/MetJ-type ribon-helix-helix transcriptional regulator
MTKKMSFNLPPQSVQRLEKMKDAAELSSYTDVVRQSLRLYEWVAEEAMKGNTFFVRKPDGTDQPVNPFMPS